MPKYRLPDIRIEPHAAYSLVRDELLLDSNARQNFASFCTTWVEDEAKQLMTDAVDKIMMDRDEYPQTAELEGRCVHILTDLWHAQRAWEAVGGSTTGSSEAAMLGGLMLPIIASVFGASIGALLGKMSGYGIDDDMMKELCKGLDDQKAILFVLVRKATIDKVLEYLQKFDGTVLRTSLSHELEDKLQQVLSASADGKKAA